MLGLLGVDGGGTRLRLALAAPDGELLGYGEAGPANPLDVGWPGVKAAVHAAYLAATAGKSEISLLAGAVGFAGVSAQASRERARELVLAHCPLSQQRLLVLPDLEIAWHSAFSSEAGIALIAGTGSVAYGRDQAGKSARAGGYGPRLDDAGSATWIGREALRLVARACDGRSAPTQLSARLHEALGCADFAALRERVARAEFARVEFAALAPVVLAAGEARDEAALCLLRRAANELAECVAAVARALQLTTPCVSFHGGLLEKPNMLRGELSRRLHETLPNLRERNLGLPPVAGALRLAAELAGQGFGERELERLRASLAARAHT